VRWSNDRELTPIKRGELGDPESLTRSDEGSVDGAEREVLIGRDQLCDPQPIGCRHWLSDQVAGRNVAEESDLCARAKARLEEVRDLGDDERWHEQRAGMFFEQTEAGFVVLIVRVDVGVQRAGVDENRYRFTSARRISSIRSEMSECPLCPAPAAISRRFTFRPPR
jgi:hypothetical protein